LFTGINIRKSILSLWHRCSRPLSTAIPAVPASAGAYRHRHTVNLTGDSTGFLSSIVFAFAKLAVMTEEITNPQQSRA
jgi:hypothetical protein